MRVTVVFNGRRQLFQDVETLNFEDFTQAVAATFDLEKGKFDILIGENVVNLDDNGQLSDFGIISGDLLLIRLHQPARPPAPPMSFVYTTNNAKDKLEKSAKLHNVPSEKSISPSTSSSTLKTCVSILSDNEELDSYVLTCLQKFMDNVKLKLVHETSLPNKDSPSIVTLRYEHDNCPTTSAELTFHFFRDNEQNNSRVTSLALLSMLFIKEKRERCFFESLQLSRASHDIECQLEDVILRPLKERLLGPDNALLRSISVVDIMLEIFQYLKPKEILNFETTCKYANWRCRSSQALDEYIWKRHLKQRFGEDVPNVQNPDTYRALYQQKVAEYRCVRTERFRPFNNPFFFPFPFQEPSNRPFERFEPRNPFAPTAPFVNPSNPLDPFTGGLIIPQHRPNIPGQPRIYPHQPDWPDPLAQPRDTWPDPDMPQGPLRRPRGDGAGLFYSQFPRRGGGQGRGGWTPYGFG